MKQPQKKDTGPRGSRPGRSGSFKNKLMHRSATELIDLVIARDSLRSAALKIAEKKLYREVIENDNGQHLKTVQWEKYYAFRNLFRSIDRALRNKHISPQIRRGLLKQFIGQIVIHGDPRRRAFQDTYGWDPPGFLIVSPTGACNLRCIGCYANSSDRTENSIPFPVLDRVMREMKELWGAHFVVVSGGEPLLWKSEGKDIFDLAAAHQDTYFLIATNGTFIDEAKAARIAECGNITPAVSVEGFEKETDAWRGKGVYQKALGAMARLREAGVPFGITVTVSRLNVELVASEEFVDFFFAEQGAIYGWLFQFMPVGRSSSLEMMITPEQRVELFRQEQELYRKRSIFLLDFENSGPLGNGCFAAGRSGGYVHIDWDGNLTPCVFLPFHTHNIIQIYREGGDLNTVLNTPFFRDIRKWQEAYSFRKPLGEMGNQIRPCPFRDHHRVFRRLVEKHHAAPTSQAAAEAIQDKKYGEDLVRYGKRVAELADPIWEERYLAPEKNSEYRPGDGESS